LFEKECFQNKHSQSDSYGIAVLMLAGLIFFLKKSERSSMVAKEKNILFLLIIFLCSSKGFSLTCTDSITQEKFSPKKIEEYAHVEGDFLSKHRVCRGKTSCIKLSNIQVLKDRNLFPRPSGSSRFFDKDFKQSPNWSGCRWSAYVTSESESRSILSLRNAVMPREAVLAKKLLLNTEAYVDNYLDDSTRVTQITSECLRFNETFESRGVPFFQRGALASEDENIPSVCQRLWSKNSEIPKLNSRLKDYRQTMFLLNLINKKKIQSLAEFEFILERLSDESDVGYNSLNIQDKKMIEAEILPSKIKFFDQNLPSELWNDSPDKVEKLTPSERHGLLKVFKSIQGINSQSDVSAMKHSLSSAYFKILNENPLLIEFKSAHPSAKELRDAFAKFHAKTKLLKEFKIKDKTDYLNFSTAVEAAIKNSPEAEQGDLCVIASKIISDKKKLNGGVENFLLAAMAVESLGASIVAKGAVKKAIGFLLGARYSGSALQVTLINDSMESLEQHSQTCLRTTTSSKSLCEVNQINSAQSNLFINSAFLGIFMIPKKAAPFVVTPVLLNTDNPQNGSR